MEKKMRKGFGKMDKEECEKVSEADYVHCCTSTLNSN